MTTSPTQKCWQLAIFFPQLSLPCFQALADAMCTLQVNRKFLGSFLIIGFAFAGSLILGNLAYKYNSVAFIQMIKQSNIVVIFCVSVAVGIEKPKVSAAQILLVVLMGASLSAYGELNFSALGIGVQLGSGGCEKHCCEFAARGGAAEHVLYVPHPHKLRERCRQ